MKEWIGLLENVAMGGGGWRLVLPNGRGFELQADITPEWLGRRVRVLGTLVENHGFMMTGDPSIAVEDIQLMDRDGD